MMYSFLIYPADRIQMKIKNRLVKGKQQVERKLIYGQDAVQTSNKSNDIILLFT